MVIKIGKKCQCGTENLRVQKNNNTHSCSGESIKHLAILELQQFRMMQLPSLMTSCTRKRHETEAPTRCPGSKSFSATPGLPDGRGTKESKDASWSLDTLSHVKQIGRLWPKY